MKFAFWRKDKVSQRNADSDWLEIPLSTQSSVVVTPRSALRCAAVYTCVKIITEAIASLPIFVYRLSDDGSRERADYHPLSPVLRDKANDETTAFEFFEQMTSDLLLYGNAFAEVQTNGNGEVVGLWRIVPEVVSVFRDKENSRKFYRVWTEKFGMLDLPAERVLHVKQLSLDGLVGISPIEMAREAIGLAIAGETFFAKFFQNAATPCGVISYPGTLREEARKNLRESLSVLYSGLSKAHRIALLEEGLKWETISIKPADAQFMDARKFQIEQIAAVFRVPFHMLMSTHPTYSSIEQFGIEFVNYCLRPQLVRWEQCLNNLTEENFFVEFSLTGLLRGDLHSRYSAYSIARNGGWLSVNDIRRLENMPPLPEGGDLYLVPLNMATTKEKMTDSQSQERKRFELLLDDAVKKVVKREINDIKNFTNYDELVKYYATKFSENYDKLILSLHYAFADVLNGELARAQDVRDIYSFAQLQNYKDIVNEDEAFKKRVIAMKRLLRGEENALSK